MKDKKVEEDKRLHAILYTDGSAMPNPGFYGFGLHGYVYDEKNIGKKTGDRKPKYLITDKGYLEIANLPDIKHESITPEYYVDGYGVYDEIGTNNIGEVESH